MKQITLGSTGIQTPQNAFGALPVQRVSMDQAVKILQRAYEGGMTFFDTARAYSDSEEKMGEAFGHMRDKIYIATKTAATTPDEFWRQLETSLHLLKTDYLDLYQFHCVNQCYRPEDGTGMYECMLKAKEQGFYRAYYSTAILKFYGDGSTRVGIDLIRETAEKFPEYKKPEKFANENDFTI